jgi:hypothetical protein
VNLISNDFLCLVETLDEHYYYLSFSCLWQFSGAMINKQQRAPKMQKVEQ